MSDPKPVQLWIMLLKYCASAQKPPVFSSRTLILKTLAEKIDELKVRVTQNLKDTIELIKWNESKGIRVLQIKRDVSSQIKSEGGRLYIRFCKRITT